MIAKPILTVAALAMVGLAPRAHATSANAAAVVYDPQTNSAIVSTADLDLSSQADVKVLDARLRSAGKAVCGAEPNIMEFGAHKDYVACLDDAYDRGVAQAKSAMSTASAGKAYAVTVAASPPLASRNR